MPSHNAFHTTRLFPIYLYLRINGMAQFCNLLIKRPSYLRQLLIIFTQIHISHHKLGQYYLHMIAELHKMVFSAAPHLRQDWAEAQRR